MRIIKGNESPGVAIQIDNALFSGLRPMVRTITSSSTTTEKKLTNYDHTIFIDSSTTVTITLPTSPIFGQEYYILCSNKSSSTVKFYIQSNKSNMQNSSFGTTGQSQQEWNARGIIYLKYLSNKSGSLVWYVMRLAD